MATFNAHQTNYGRKFFIGRQNGQTNKNGDPHFFEWLKEMPADTEKRDFEVRVSDSGEKRVYELHRGLIGFITAIDITVKQFDSTRKPEHFLTIELVDADGTYSVEIGRKDSSWSMDLLKRLLDPNFQPNQKVSLVPFSIHDKEKNRYNIGVSCTSGGVKLLAKYTLPHLAGMPEAERHEIDDEVKWSYKKQAAWLFEQVQARVVPRLFRDPLAVGPAGEPQPKPNPVVQPAAIKATLTQDFPTNEPADDDDLPF